ncbi:hypothetical protein MASR2M15_27190 [Anaerolineales bacterium]
MAVETAQMFLKRLDHEQTLRTQLYISNPKGMDQFLQFAHGKGFIFEKEDLNLALNQNHSEKLIGLKQQLLEDPS